MSDWHKLLDRTLRGFARLSEQGQPNPEWVLGGGTALMLFASHRLSKDIDVFIDDPQYLALLSPDLTDVWNCSDWDKAAHYLKLRFPEGEIDFIVTAPVSKLLPVDRDVDLSDIRPAYEPVIKVDQPAEIALKKMHYRATMLKPRDIFDIAVVDKIAHDALIDNLRDVADKRDDLLYRLDSISADFLRRELAELDIQPGWQKEQGDCLDTVRSIVERIGKSAPLV